MSEKNIDCAIAHFDKKVTDYQLHVDRELIKKDKKIKELENYMFSLETELKRALDEIIKLQNVLLGGDE